MGETMGYNPEQDDDKLELTTDEERTVHARLVRETMDQWLRSDTVQSLSREDRQQQYDEKLAQVEKAMIAETKKRLNRGWSRYEDLGAPQL